MQEDPICKLPKNLKNILFVLKPLQNKQ